MKASIVRLVGYLVISTAILVSAPVWASQEYKFMPADIKYLSLGELGFGYSQHGGFAEIGILKLGWHWPRPSGVEGTVVKIINYIGKEETVISVAPLGIYLPILLYQRRQRKTKPWHGFMNGLINANFRAHLFNVEAPTMKLFPPLFDVCLEWRSLFGMITYIIIDVGYRRQIGTFEYDSRLSNTSGIFIGLRVIWGTLL